MFTASKNRLLEEREKVISEIISTELSYVENLQTIIELLIVPIRDAGSTVLDQNEFQFQFGSWEMIYGIHKDLYENMLREQYNNRLYNIPQMFFEFSEYLRLYKTYVTNFGIAMNRRGMLMTTNKRYAAAVENARNDARCRSGVESLLITPIQRIPRYQILLEQLLKYYDINDKQTINEYQAISQSLIKIKEVADEHNQAIITQENKKGIMEVMMSIDARSRINLLDNPSRKLIKGGTLRQLTKSGMKDYMFWLFSDKLIYAEPISTLGMSASFTLKQVFSLAHCRVMDAYGHPHVQNTQMALIFHSTISSFVLYFK